MGLTGFIIALQKLESILLIKNTFSTYVLYIVALIFICISFFYIAKMIFYFSSVREEINNPVRLNFFPTFSISMLLLSIAFLEVNMDISKYLFIIAAPLHFIATIAILSLWVRQTKFEIHHFNPAWFIPIVGNILIPVSGAKYFSSDLSWFFFSAGIIFWILLFTIFLYRIIFHQPIHEKLIPTLFILIAPPAIGFISYVKLNGSIDNFAKILYYLALFLLVFLISQFKIFYKIKFYLSWWAYSFPVASITIATSLFYKQTGLAFYKSIFFVLMGLLILFILLLLPYTVRAIIRREICVKEE
jgi:tellurite resistance protein